MPLTILQKKEPQRAALKVKQGENQTKSQKRGDLSPEALDTHSFSLERLTSGKHAGENSIDLIPMWLTPMDRRLFSWRAEHESAERLFNSA